MLLDLRPFRTYVPDDMECSVRACKGRPREFDVDEALAAALQVFWSKGYEGTSLTDLTDAMGITRPSLYAAFGNKEALFRKALDLYEREKLAYVSEALDAPTSRQVAERLLRGALQLQTSECQPRGCLGVISSMTCGAEAESVRTDLMARRASSHQAICERLQRAKLEGDLPAAADAGGLCNYLLAILQGMSVQAGSGASKQQLETPAGRRTVRTHYQRASQRGVIRGPSSKAFSSRTFSTRGAAVAAIAVPYLQSG